MWNQIGAIAWVQFRTIRNHLPRTNVGSVLMWLLSLLWYGTFAGLGTALAIALPNLSVAMLLPVLPIALFAILGFWQLVPVMTLSSGWSLELSKLQVYPIHNETLFMIEILLRITTSPEMLFILLGGMVGLLRHPAIPIFAPLFLLLYIPINLFLCLGLREVFMQIFLRKKRFREIRTLLIVSIGVVPQIFLRTSLGSAVKPYLIAASRGPGTPWYELGRMSLGYISWVSVGMTLVWIVLTYAFARWQFARSLVQGEEKQAESLKAVPMSTKPSIFAGVLDLPNRLTRDPMAALLQKEFRSLIRMPRFRVVFGMSCIFSVFIFIPIMLQGGPGRGMSTNILPMVTLYGLLILGEVLIFNMFGFDRRAAQIYFVTPVSLATVLKAKNLVAVTFAIFQTAAVIIVSALFRIEITPLSVLNSVCVAAVVVVFLISVGNLTSVHMARPIDPNQTFRKQSGGKMQLWMFLSFLGLSVPIALAYLARWALQTNWAFLGVLVIDFVIGLIVYRLATESAIKQAMLHGEQIVDGLARGANPIAV